MKAGTLQSNVLRVVIASRPKFFTAAIAPVLVGSALGYADSGSFSTGLFFAALVSMVFLQAGANLSNDYYDHLSKNDWLNKNVTPFSGGGRSIQNNLLTPKAVFLAALVALIFGATIGIVIVIVTQSLLVLGIGILGFIGAFFYTAKPIQLGYRTIGEVVILMLFGVMPVYAACFLQTNNYSVAPLLPGFLVGILIFLIILINEFPDAAADAAVQKKTIVVRFGAPVAVWVYRTVLALSYIVAAAMFLYSAMFYAALLYMLTLPLAVQGWKLADAKELTKPGEYGASQITVMLHAAGSLALAIGFVVAGLRS